MKRIFGIVGLLVGLATGVATAQARVGVSLSPGDPYFAAQVVIGRPHYHRYAHHHSLLYRYRPFYNAPRVIVTRPYRDHPRRYHHRGW
jgi:hypothetical protein